MPRTNLTFPTEVMQAISRASLAGHRPLFRTGLVVTAMAAATTMLWTRCEIASGFQIASRLSPKDPSSPTDQAWQKGSPTFQAPWLILMTFLRWTSLSSLLPWGHLSLGLRVTQTTRFPPRLIRLMVNSKLSLVLIETAV